MAWRTIAGIGVALGLALALWGAGRIGAAQACDEAGSPPTEGALAAPHCEDPSYWAAVTLVGVAAAGLGGGALLTRARRKPS
jgi:hypothetical protein